jgi:hypothetical protein
MTHPGEPAIEEHVCAVAIGPSGQMKAIGVHGETIDRCPGCGSASKGAYSGKLCDHRWHTTPRLGEVPMASVDLKITQLPDESTEKS